MNKDWVESEFKIVDLGDKRLNKRLMEISENFANEPESPINQASKNWSETKAAYRFFKNDDIDYKEILKSHIQATKKRCEEYSVILSVQDTTYFNYTSHPKTTGLCALSKSRGKHNPKIETLGLIMHSALAITTDGLPLGLLAQKIYSRPEQSDEIKELKKKTRNTLSIEEKDSFRWLELLQGTCDISISEKTKVVTISDRESDIYDFFKLSENLKMPVLIRANHDRTINKNSIHSKNSGEKLWEFMKKKKIRGSLQIQIPAKENILARTADLNVRFKKYKLNPPKTKKADSPSLDLFAIYLTEVNQPEGIEPIEWMLITNLPVENFDDAVEKIKWYCLRWRIEVFHKILKSGFKVEDCRLSTADRLIRYLAVVSVAAWRIFWITLVARIAPDANCLLFLNDIEWKVLFKKFNQKDELPNIPPTLKKCVNWIAQLGGFLARKCDKEPGVIYLWRGLKKFADILEGVKIARCIYG